jgi:hypothetical protein
MLNRKGIKFLAPSAFVIEKFSLHDYNYDYDYFRIFFNRLRLRLRNRLCNQRGNRLCNRRDYTSLIGIIAKFSF